MFMKWLTMPSSNAVEQVGAVQTWEVRWVSRHGTISFAVRQEVEVFTSEEAADRFATSLRNAFKLLRHTSECFVEMKKSKSL